MTVIHQIFAYLSNLVITDSEVSGDLDLSAIEYLQFDVIILKSVH